MQCIVLDIYYFDYVLYKYIEYLATDKEKNDTFQYYANTVEAVGNNLKEVGYLMEEEVRVKYIVYLIEEKIFGGFFKTGVDLKFRQVLDLLQYTNPVPWRLDTLQRLVLWGYHLLVGGKDPTWEYYKQLSTEEWEELVGRDVSSDRKEGSSLSSLDSRYSYISQLRSLFHEQVIKIKGRLGIPYYATVPLTKMLQSKPPPTLSTVEDQDLEMIAAELTSIYLDTQQSQSASGLGVDGLESTYIENTQPTAHAHSLSPLGSSAYTKHIAYSKPVHLSGGGGRSKSPSLFTAKPGTTPVWSEPGLEIPQQRPNRLKETVVHPDGAIEYTGRLYTEKKRKVWTIEEETRFIAALQKHSKCWAAIQEYANFSYLSQQQLKDKYRSLVKSGKIKPDD
ncbi:hypothetical protein NEHOM01_0389 [Nematocida homosporus]|uniref:uncharacterized protein n=1 Tax=Nematocida homosporus TaxID=1912981 RepID=UPI00221F8E7B|nr:uncharacterized protein NEHOM01_0389 [Nematocida homosporus]KAI5184787.1 hypothetical protein NEHOM01_0389 [Nematocida homosporus]